MVRCVIAIIQALASTGDKAEFGDVPFYQPKTYKGIVIEDTLVTTVSSSLLFALFWVEKLMKLFC